MDSSPTRPPAEADAGLSEAIRDALSALGEAPCVADLAAVASGFVNAGIRFTQGIGHTRALDGASLRKRGMILSALTLRCRELAARWRLFDAAVTASGIAVTPSDAPAPQPPAPCAGVSLAAALDAFEVDWGRTLEIARAIPDSPSGGERLALLGRMRDSFRRGARTLLDGPDGLLKAIPAAHERVSGEIFRQEYLGGE